MQYNFLQPFLRKEKRWETGYRYLRSCMFIIGMLWSALVFAQAPNQFGGTGGTPAGFQVDANFLSQQLGIPGTSPYNGQEILPGQDWGGVNGVLLWNGTRYIPGKNTLTNAQWIVDEIWAGGKVDLTTFAGSNKNDDDISAASSKWGVGTGSGPQKNDITNVFVHTRTAPNGDVWLVYGIETRSVNGNSYLDLEYNQAGVVLDGNKLTGKGIVGGRTVGDLLIIVDYEQGGKRPKVELRSWTAAGIWSAPSTSAVDGVNIYETTNLSDEPHVAAGAGFTGGGDPSDVSMALQFVEGAINLTALGIIQTTECNISSTLNIKSRSSSSFTSELKDFVLFQFSFLEPPTVLVNSPVICEGKSATISADASGGKPPYQYQWTVPMGVPNPGNVASFTASVAGTYSVKVSDANQCKGDGSGTLKINLNTSSTQSRTICSNELPYSWDGLIFEAAGSKTKTGLINQFGCDSTATFNLAVNPTTSSTQSKTICSNELPYSWDGLIFEAAGSKTKTGLKNQFGCDSIATFNLAVNPTTSSLQSKTICSNELPYSWDGLIFEAAGSKTKTGLKNKFGCDSTATFNLAVNPTTSSIQSKTICSNELPYSWDGLIFEAAGSKTKTGLKNQFGCDSTATFNLAVNLTTSSTQSKTICANELPYSWDGLVFEAAGSKTKSGLKNQFDCDSTATFNLIVNANPVCEISGPFTQAAAPLPNICIGGGQPAPVVNYKAPEGNYTYQWSVSEIGGAPFEPGSELLIIVGDANNAMVAVQVIGGGWLMLKITDKATGCASDCYVPVTTTPNAACTLEGPAKACTNDVVTYATTAVDGATYNWSIAGDATILSAMPYGNSIQVKAGGVGSYTVFLVITKEGECPSYCDWTTSVELCGLPYCTYTQGYFGNIGGIACTPQGPRTTTALITESLAAMPGGKLYLGIPGRSFTASTASYIIGILPGGGSANMLPAGDYVNATTASFLRRGKINNVLLSQTIALALNTYMPGSQLGAFSLADGAGMEDKWLITVAKQGNCDLKDAVAAECKFTPIYSPCGDGKYISGYTTSYNPFSARKLSSKVINALPGDKTVMDLLNLASAALGGSLPAELSYSDIAGAVGLINEAFDECRIFVGISSKGDISDYCMSPAPEMCDVAMVASASGNNASEAAMPSVVLIDAKDLTVNAYPNPFKGQLSFRFVSPVSGNAKLEVFNASGQRLSVVFDGKVSAGVQNFVRYNPVSNVNGLLIYKLTVGDKSVTGKVQSLQ